MEIQKIKESDKTTIKISGKLNTFECEKLDPVMDSLEEDEYKNLVFDVSDLEYISSSGLRTLLKANNKAASMNGKVVICGVSEDIYEIFEVTGFDLIFKIIKK